ncbi:MAG TPA: hypothetical protein VMU05_11565 [Dongiaceae bacterium]|nr:hypothetical protein [Dongiaceae bacterium]
MVGQLIPAGLLVTLPLPVRLTDNDDVGGGGGGPWVVVKSAVTLSFPFATNVQVGEIAAFPFAFFLASLASPPMFVQAPL